MNKRKCRVCKRIELIKQNKNPYFVKELKTGYVVIGDYQFYKGYSLFLSKTHHTEIHQLDKEIRKTFLFEMSLVAEAVYKAFKPKKLNYELLGNADSHMHWHFFPRHKDDPNPEHPTWVYDRSVRYDPKNKPSTKELESLREKLSNQIDELVE